MSYKIWETILNAAKRNTKSNCKSYKTKLRPSKETTKKRYENWKKTRDFMLNSKLNLRASLNANEENRTWEQTETKWEGD